MSDDATPRGALQLLSTLGIAAYLSAGVLGAVVTILLGPYLAMGAAIYVGNTEPVTPERGYPWLLVVLFGLLMAGGKALSRSGNEVAGELVTHLAGGAFAIVPFVHIYRLWAVT